MVVCYANCEGELVYFSHNEYDVWYCLQFGQITSAIAHRNALH